MGGVCQASHQSCLDGWSYKENAYCGGPRARQCCAPYEETVSNWSGPQGDDADCVHKFGTCQAEGDVCKSGVLNADYSLCGGPHYRVCCEIGESESKSWEEEDGTCLDLEGECMHEDLACEKWSTEGSCGGPATRQCCVSIKSLEEIKKNQRYHALLLGFSSVALVSLLIAGYIYLKRLKCSGSYNRVSDQKWYQRKEGGSCEEETSLTSGGGGMTAEESCIMKDYQQMLGDDDDCSYA